MTDGFVCPRRAEGPTRFPGNDIWRSGVGLIGQERGCSYCGGMHPDDFLRLIKGGHAVGPTDKAYKAYVRDLTTNRDVGKFYYQHLSDEQMAEFIALYNDQKMAIGYPGYFYVMPWFMKPIPHGSKGVSSGSD